MRYLRRWVYRLGFRPRLGSVFHSPSLHAQEVMRHYAEGFTQGIQEAERKRTRG